MRTWIDWPRHWERSKEGRIQVEEVARRYARAPNFLYERKDIYDIAEFYQAKIEERGQWDEIDLCREAIRHIGKKQGARFGYDLVVCDEVQDFADKYNEVKMMLPNAEQLDIDLPEIQEIDPKEVIRAKLKEAFLGFLQIAATDQLLKMIGLFG